MDIFNLLVGGLFSVVGMALFASGKKSTNLVFMVGGVLLIAYPYFVESHVMMVLVGIAICAGAWFARDFG